MYILGISAFYHDSAACLIRDGEILAAAQEERFTRVKHDYRFPRNAIKFCLDFKNISIKDISYVAFYEKSSTKFDRLLKTYLMYAPVGFVPFSQALPVWLKEKLWIKQEIRKILGFSGTVITPEHHESHASSAFFPSPFEKAAILTMDGVGEWATTSFGYGKKNSINLNNQINFPHSLGLLYSAFTSFTGFRVNSGEYKLMGLAPYGEPKYKSLIYDKLIDVKDDGSFRLNMKFFNYCAGLTMTNKKFASLFGRQPRKPESPITKSDMDLAASIQVVTEEVVLKIAQHIHKKLDLDYLCLGGGVALNCVANGRLLREGPFKNIWIQPAAGDAGGALGAALYVWYQHLGNSRSNKDRNDFQKGSYLGPSYSDKQIDKYLSENNLPFTRFKNCKELSIETAKLLNKGNVIGWFKGKMEFGPRALGSRSILGDPRSSNMQSQMNLKIKFRESFRPFAPSILSNHVEEWFRISRKGSENIFASPYMLLVGKINEKQIKGENSDNFLVGFDRLKQVKSKIPAVTHVDNSARVQTVDKNINPEYHNLLTEFYKLTGCPILINTSFNVRGEPIVESPIDAYRCFMRTEMDYLVLGNFLLSKSKQPVFNDISDWRQEYELD